MMNVGLRVKVVALKQDFLRVNRSQNLIFMRVSGFNTSFRSSIIKIFDELAQRLEENSRYVYEAQFMTDPAHHGLYLRLSGFSELDIPTVYHVLTRDYATYKTSESKQHGPTSYRVS